MKTRKILSAVLSVAMLLSMHPAASAVSPVKTEPLSEYAGQTIPVQVVEETEDGLVSRFIEVDIPEDATEAEQLSLIHSAALGWGDASPLSVNQTVYPISDRHENFTITSTPQSVGGGTLAGTLDYIVVDFVVTAMDRSSERLCLQFENLTTGNTSGWEQIKPATEPWHITFVKSNTLGMNSGNSISVNAKIYFVTGYVNLSRCTVTGYANTNSLETM